MREYAHAKKKRLCASMAPGATPLPPARKTPPRRKHYPLFARFVVVAVGFFLDALEYDLSGLVFYELFRLVEIP